MTAAWAEAPAQTPTQGNRALPSPRGAGSAPTSDWKPQYTAVIKFLKLLQEGFDRIEQPIDPGLKHAYITEQCPVREK